MKDNEHFQRDCPFKSAWLANAQLDTHMANPEEGQICDNCIPQSRWREELEKERIDGLPKKDVCMGCGAHDDVEHSPKCGFHTDNRDCNIYPKPNKSVLSDAIVNNALP